MIFFPTVEPETECSSGWSPRTPQPADRRSQDGCRWLCPATFPSIPRRTTEMARSFQRTATNFRFEKGRISPKGPPFPEQCRRRSPPTRLPPLGMLHRMQHRGPGCCTRCNNIMTIDASGATGGSGCCIWCIIIMTNVASGATISGERTRQGSERTREIDERTRDSDDRTHGFTIEPDDSRTNPRPARRGAARLSPPSRVRSPGEGRIAERTGTQPGQAASFRL